MKTKEQRIIEHLRQSLWEIANPLKYLQNKAESLNAQLDGGFALQLCKDANWLSGKAKVALEQFEVLQSEPDKDELREEMINILPMFGDESNLGNEKRDQLEKDYETIIPGWEGSYGQGFADCFNWISKEINTYLKSK